MSKVAYLRVSAQDQNLDRQEAMFPEAEYKCFVEKASGKDTNGRPELKRMLDYIREGDTVYIESISRLSRSISDLLDIVKQISRKSVELVSLKENIDTKTPTGRFVLQLFGALSELEREQLRLRQAEGIKAAKANGKSFGRPRAEYPENWKALYARWDSGEISGTRAIKESGLKRDTFYTLVERYSKETGKAPERWKDGKPTLMTRGKEGKA
jgi:DNA invertase Pin-like site-specific DNA recombinase